jgi:hypothetical protein
MSFVEDIQELQTHAGEAPPLQAAPPVDNPPPAPESPRPAPKRGSPLQEELDRVSQQCTELSRLSCRLGEVLRAVRGETPHGGNRQPHPIPAAPKSPSWLDGMRYFNACHVAVLGDLAEHVEELEALLAVVPRETKASSST